VAFQPTGIGILQKLWPAVPESDSGKENLDWKTGKNVVHYS
jgi:hypothetical protein